ncbi:Apoptosis inhibitor IAP [Cyphomyrmex costatus]|uniref:Apoptosis inhibitor IAP n=1 Tax=Cyphomyrmex costatus TaxID=456900 RepID=A0A195CZT4_9HYME|nr:Apoptosis inhibitor IAP [Cyphomyrmex costatus]
MKLIIKISSLSLDYRFEVVRLKSFFNWPHAWKKSKEFAAAGFYYTGDSDIVKCFECGKELWKWKAEDNPMADHKRYSRNCWFVYNIPCGNVPIDTDPSTIPAFLPKGVDECGIYDCTNIPKFDSNCKEVSYRLKELMSNPQYPEYSEYSARLASYDKWPKALSQSKEELAIAGFYYSGSGDETLCYYCGGGLMDWEPFDDPWIEHAKWFDKCLYLLVMKGKEFVHNTAKKTHIETITSAVDKLLEKLEEDSNEIIGNGNTQNSVNSEETNTEASIVSGKDSTEQKSVQIQSDKPHNKDYATLCKICFNRELQVAFIPCGHVLACVECANNMQVCGVCRKDIDIAVQVHFT